MWLLLVYVGVLFFQSPNYFVGATLEKSSAPTQDWTALTTSLSGAYTYTATNSGGLYISSDFGSVWSLSSSSLTSSVYLFTVSCDETGQYVIAGAYDGNILVSFDYGSTFAVANAPIAQWRSSCMSSNGSIAYAATFNGSMSISHDTGLIWNNLTTQPYARGYYSVACDSSGQFVIAAINANHPVYISHDYGRSWFAPLSIKPAATYTATAVSYDGQIILAAAYENGIYISYDNGTTWKQATSQALSYTSLACDRNCSYIIAAAYYSHLLLSYDSGSTWSFLTAAGSRLWYAVSSNYDGSYVVAAVTNSGIWTGSVIPVPSAQPTISPHRPTSQPTSQPSTAPSLAAYNYISSSQLIINAVITFLLPLSIISLLIIAACYCRYLRGKSSCFGHRRYDHRYDIDLEGVASRLDDDVPVEAHVEIVPVATRSTAMRVLGEATVINNQSAVTAQAVRVVETTV